VQQNHDLVNIEKSALAPFFSESVIDLLYYLFVCPKPNHLQKECRPNLLYCLRCALSRERPLSKRAAAQN
jgi:hypothetical protein